MKKSFKTRITEQLIRPVSATNLGILRFGFGVLMCMMCYKYQDIAETFWLQHSAIPFPGLEFIKPLELDHMKNLLYVGMGAAALVAVGFLYRYAIVTLTLILTYSVLISRVIFNNHYYLFALIAFLLIFTHADERVSVKSWFRKGTPKKIPYWQYAILQLQIAIVFFHGGLAKINPDWLSGAVMDPMVWQAFGIFKYLPEVSLALSWSGMLFDLLIGFFLFWKKTRKWAVIITVVFNLANGLLLFDDIGLFPYTMIVVTVLLFSNYDWLNLKLQKLGAFPFPIKRERGLKTTPLMNVWVPVLYAHFIFQFLFPFRHYFIEGNPEWTGQAAVFAWRMKSSSKLIKLQLKAIDKRTGEFVSDINLNQDFRREQIFAFNCYQVWYMANRSYDRFVERGSDRYGVTAEYFVAMNGQPMQMAIDPDVDLTEVDYHKYGENRWIIPWKRQSREEVRRLQELELKALRNNQLDD